MTHEQRSSEGRVYIYRGSLVDKYLLLSTIVENQFIRSNSSSAVTLSDYITYFLYFQKKTERADLIVPYIFLYKRFYINFAKPLRTNTFLQTFTTLLNKMSDFLDPFFNSISRGNCLADASTNLPTYDPFFNSVSTAASANRPIRTRANTRRILANDTFANRRLAFASTNPPTYDPFFNSLSTAASANRPIRTRARTRRTIANDTFANRSIHPRAKKRRITDDMRASEAVRFALGLLEDEFN